LSFGSEQQLLPLRVQLQLIFREKIDVVACTFARWGRRRVGGCFSEDRIKAEIIETALLGFSWLVAQLL